MTTTKLPVDEPTKTAGEIEAREDGEDWSDFDWGWDEPKRPLTTKELLESGLVGLWKDRTDIGDTLEFARELRRRSNTRSRN